MNYTDLKAEINALCDTTDTSYPAADKLRRINAAYEHIVGRLLTIDGRWQFDDSNYTKQPIGYMALVAGQQDYAFDVAFLTIEYVSVLDATGKYVLLHPIDPDDMRTDPSQFETTDGLPMYYDKIGNSIYLYPKPAAGSVTLARGLKVGFQRTASLFELSDSTKEPGFASPFHALLAYRASLPYCMTYKKDRVPLYLNEAMRLGADCMKFYAKRQKDERPTITISNGLRRSGR